MNSKANEREFACELKMLFGGVNFGLGRIYTSFILVTGILSWKGKYHNCRGEDMVN